jgi:hypothetical protein
MMEYNTITQSYYASQFVPVPESCNGFVAVNEGDMLWYVNGFPLQPNPNWATNKLPGVSTGAIGNVGEVYVGNNKMIQVVLDTSGAGTNPKLIIVWKYYIKNC